MIIGAVCLFYYILLCVVLKRWNATFSRFWLVLGIFFLLAGIIPQNDIAERILYYGTLLGMQLFLITMAVICMGMISGGAGEYECLIVLGAQVRGRTVTDSLKRRLDKAQEYLKDHPNTYVIVSGGQGTGEDISEAEAMAHYLQMHGIGQERIIRENKSKTTKENLKFSFGYIKNPSGEVGIVSNNFHVYRACLYAKKAGIEKPYPVVAGCHPVLFVNYMVRECFAVWKMLLGQR